MYDPRIARFSSFILEAKFQVAAQFLGQIDIPEIVLSRGQAFQDGIGDRGSRAGGAVLYQVGNIAHGEFSLDRGALEDIVFKIGGERAGRVVLPAPLRSILFGAQLIAQSYPEIGSLCIGKGRLNGKLFEVEIAAVKIGAGIVLLVDALP
jgi:hypothetical protein